MTPDSKVSVRLLGTCFPSKWEHCRSAYPIWMDLNSATNDKKVFVMFPHFSALSECYM